MSIDFKNLYRALCLMVAAQSAHATGGGLAAAVQPSDCRPRDVDSTCAAAVAGAPAPILVPSTTDSILYDGPLGGVPAAGYAYWGFDFVADETGLPSPVRADQFINRSSVPVTITLSFNYPTNRTCNKDCLPGVEFEVDAGWYKLDPPFVIKGDVASVTEEFAPGRGFGWAIGLWQSSNPRLTVTVPKGAMATLEDVGLPKRPSIATEIAARTKMCPCMDGTQATCSDGTHFSNGLLGTWTRNNAGYQRAGAFDSCPSAK